MKKEDSLALKGVAIIMMLLYHLFYCGTGGGKIPDIVYFNEIHQWSVVRFSEICYPVSLYVLLTGYGLYCTFENLTWGKILKKVAYIYLHLWIIYLIFLPIASYLMPGKYPGSISELLKNVFSVSASYCTEQWFLFPYLILYIFSKWICRFIQSHNSKLVLLLSSIIYALYLVIYKMVGVGFISNHFGILVNLYFVMAFFLPFTLGAIAKKEKWVESISIWTDNHFGQRKGWYVWSMLLVIIAFRMVLHNQSIQPFVVLLLFLLFPLLGIKDKVKNALMYLGKHSMNIWLIHGWICFYLFTNVICMAKYPIGIFIVTLVWSLLISIVVEFVYKHLFARYF